MDVFSLVGRISVNYSDAINNIERVTRTAGDAAENLHNLDDAAEDTDDSVNNAGESAEKANGGFSTWKATLANLASNVITSVISKCAELAGKIVDLTKTAVGNYAEYEQLVGGVETLFGDSSEQLMKYAEDAYKTAGLSTNDYMNTATSFAASLIQGLGGDTKKAVEMTNLAITDMSDNANKMGTDIESIQTAYQGFAKQNYTMLDNLKLGYGGTQAEMVRLINESGILDNEITDLNGISFDQIITAIHSVQDDLHITGTTVKEAGSTISGSWGSIQGMFQNILTKIGGKIAPAIMRFLSQLSEWMETVDWDAFAEKIGDAFGTALEWVQQIDFESFFQAGIEGLGNFIEGLGNFVVIAVTVLEHLGDLKDIFITLAPIIAAVTASVIAYKTAMMISTIIDTVKNSIMAFKAANEGATIAQWAMNVAMNANPIMLIVSLIAGLITAIMTLWATNEDFRNAVIAWGQAIVDSVNWWIDNIIKGWETIVNSVGSAIQAVVDFFKSFADNIGNTFNNIKNTIVNIWNSIVNFLKNIFNSIKTIFLNAWEGIKSVWSGVSNFFLGIWNGIKGAFSKVGSWFSDIFTGAWNGIKSAWSGVGNFFGNIWNGIKNAFSNVTDWFKNVFSGAWQAVKNVFSAGGKIFDGIKDGILNAFKVVVNGIIDGINWVIAQPFNGINAALQGIKDVDILGLKPFDWVNTIDVPQIPKLAKGGIVKDRTTAVVGEQGAEAIVPLENNTGWIDRVAEKINSIRQKNMNESNIFEISLNIENFINSREEDIEEIADRLMEIMQDKIDRKGYAFS